MRALPLLASIAVTVQACAVDCPTTPEGRPAKLLSELGAFSGNVRDQLPAPGVIPYELQSPLFTDYTRKRRFIQLPPGTKISYHSEDVFDLPIGGRIYKTFSHDADLNDPSKGEKLHETRILERNRNGYVPYLFIWKEDQTDAECRPAGATLPAQWVGLDGGTEQIDYQTPNVDQCQFCHGYYDPKLLGVRARQLNHLHDYGQGPINQLDHLASLGLLDGTLPPESERVTQLSPADTTASLEDRVRSYQDINCGMCHNPKGLARLTGLYLNLESTDPFDRGICRPVVAYLRGGGLDYVIQPGRTELSTMMFRLNSFDPDIHMPAGFNKTVDVPNVQLINDWISAMPPQDCP